MHPPRSPRRRPVRRITNKITWWGVQRVPHKARSAYRLWYRKFYGAFRGAEGAGGAYPITLIGGQHPHTKSRHEYSSLDACPWATLQKTRGRRQQETSGASSGDRCNGRSRRSLLPTRSRGACIMRRRVFPSGFPHHVEDFGPTHHFSRIPIAGGAASSGAAQPRVAAAGRGAVVRDLQDCNRVSMSTGTGYIAQKMLCLRNNPRTTISRTNLVHGH